MIRVQLHRAKCIGCNYCVEAWPERWQMSQKDGKCVLIGSKKKGPFYQVMVGEYEREFNNRAAEVCPVDVIRVD